MNPLYAPQVARLAPLGTGAEEQEQCWASSSPTMHQLAWKSLVGQAGTPRLEEEWGDAGQSFHSRGASGEEEKKREISVCFFWRRLLSARSLYLVIIKGLFCCQ